MNDYNCVVVDNSNESIVFTCDTEKCALPVPETQYSCDIVEDDPKDIMFEIPV